MRRARDAILAHGGAATSNVFTRCLLALFGVIPWRGVPVMPVEIMNLPSWFPFHLSKISYWARTVLVPLLVLMTLKPRARNPRGIAIAELFVQPPEQVRRWPKGPRQVWPWSGIFGALDAVLHVVEPWFPRGPRKKAIDKAVAFVIERLNGEDGLGAIFPAMANTVMMFDVLGYSPSDPRVAIARASIEKRYGTFAGYKKRWEAARDDLVKRRYLLAEDADRLTAGLEKVRARFPGEM